ncbi:hypothetical protein MKW98_023183 [Papaver atlanticum]|uniref:Uncharacterized protein n=1 Tax=Papaver atlanticum TaxID=357466 RepID=A0AAD4XGN2_9MAGN|nr:hypothetical protein MKW98_023183 [Papaver atlanticum]
MVRQTHCISPINPESSNFQLKKRSSSRIWGIDFQYHDLLLYYFLPEFELLCVLTSIFEGLTTKDFYEDLIEELSKYG